MYGGNGRCSISRATPDGSLSPPALYYALIVSEQYFRGSRINDAMGQGAFLACTVIATDEAPKLTDGLVATARL